MLLKNPLSWSGREEEADEPLELWTTKALCPDGIKWRVFLFEPYPIYRYRIDQLY